MVLPESVVAAVLTILIRNLLKRLPFMAVLPSPVLEDSSINLLNPGTIIAGAGTIGSVFCYLTRNRHPKWKEYLRKLPSIKFHRIVEKCIEKAKSRVNNHFQGSRKLQQNAIMFLANQPEDINGRLKISTTQNGSRFIPTSSYSKTLMTYVEVEEPAGTSVSEIMTSDVPSASNVSFQQESQTPSTISNEVTQLILIEMESSDVLSENYDYPSE